MRIPGERRKSMRLIFMSFIWFLLLIQPIEFANAGEASSISLSLPDLKWALEINISNLKLERSVIATSGEAAKLYATDSKAGMTVSALLEQAPQKGDSRECRAYYWSKVTQSLAKRENIREYELGEMALVDYIVPEYQGMQVKQRNINVCLAKSHYWININLSKNDYGPKDDDLFNQALNAIKINDNYSPSSFDYFNYGTLYYRQNKYSNAIPYFEKAFEIEKKAPALEEDLFKALVDLLGVSYGMSGDLDKQKSIFTWAIAKYPEFPMFYYNLACAYAESYDMDGAIKNLQKAYKYKANVLPGETFPDPLSDSSFERYLKNKTFIDELNKMIGP